MKIRDLTELAARNLREAILRNSLTTLGISVGVASLVAMLSLGVGLQQLLNTRLERSGLFDSVMVRPPMALAGQAGGGPGPNLRRPPRPSAAVLAHPLDEAARHQLAGIPHVLEVYPEFRFTGDIRFGAEGAVAQISSLPPSAASSDGLEGMQGRFFSSPEAKEIIVQKSLADDLAETQHFQTADLIGKQITLRYAGRQPMSTEAPGNSTASPQRPAAPSAPEAEASPDDAALGFSIISSQMPLQIVGIVDASAVASGANAFVRSGAYVPLAIAQAMNVVQGNDMAEVVRESTLGGGKHYSSLTIRVDRPSTVESVEASVRQMGYSAFSLLDVTSNLRRVFGILDLLLGIFGSLALAVASLGIINTLVMAILERRREIGVLKALGASESDIRRLFFAEAGVMGIFGGVTGVALGWAIGRAIQFATDFYLRRQSIPTANIWTVPWWLVLGAIGFSVLVSLLAGIYPASRAARLDPVEALRYQ